MKKNLMCFLMLMLFTVQLAAAQMTVTGEVVDSQSEPLPGATVTVKGTSTATTTNIDGEFAIKAKAGDVLSVSFVGFETTEVRVSETTP